MCPLTNQAYCLNRVSRDDTGRGKLRRAYHISELRKQSYRVQKDWDRQNSQGRILEKRDLHRKLCKSALAGYTSRTQHTLIIHYMVRKYVRLEKDWPIGIRSNSVQYPLKPCNDVYQPVQKTSEIIGHLQSIQKNLDSKEGNNQSQPNTLWSCLTYLKGKIQKNKIIYKNPNCISEQNSRVLSRKQKYSVV